MKMLAGTRCSSSGCESNAHGRALSAATNAIAPESGQIIDSEVCATAPSVVAGGGDTAAMSRSQLAGGGSGSVAASDDCDASSPSHDEGGDDRLVSPLETGAESATAVALDDAGGGSAGTKASVSWGGVTVHADPSKEHGRLLPSLMVVVIPPSPPPLASRHSASLTARLAVASGAAVEPTLS